MSDDDTSSNDDAALSDQLDAIAGQPLTERAASFVELHDQLKARLEGSDTGVTHE